MDSDEAHPEQDGMDQDAGDQDMGDVDVVEKGHLDGQAQSSQSGWRTVFSDAVLPPERHKEWQVKVDSRQDAYNRLGSLP